MMKPDYWSRYIENEINELDLVSKNNIENEPSGRQSILWKFDTDAVECLDTSTSIPFDPLSFCFQFSPRVSAEVDAPVDVGDDGGGATPSTVAPPSDECLRDSYCKVLAENRSLSGELVSAQSEIAMLRARLKQLEVRHRHGAGREKPGSVLTAPVNTPWSTLACTSQY